MSLSRLTERLERIQVSKPSIQLSDFIRRLNNPIADEAKLLTALQALPLTELEINKNVKLKIFGIVINLDLAQFAAYYHRPQIADFFEKQLNPKNYRNYLQLQIQALQKIIGALKQKNIHDKYINKYQQRLEQVRTQLYNSKKYSANTSALLLSDLFVQVNNLAGEAIVPTDDKVFLVTNAKTQETSLYSLADIVVKMKEATGVTQRNLQYIAIGVSGDGKYYITSNNYTPCVFRLDDILQGKEHFKTVWQKKRAQGDSKLAHSTANIHAETMLAALADNLALTKIMVVSASGEKNLNCVCCANFLAAKGFSQFVKSHSSIIKSYPIPTDEQITAADKFLELLAKELPTGQSITITPLDNVGKIQENALERQKPNFFSPLVRRFHIPHFISSDTQTALSVEEQQNTITFACREHSKDLSPTGQKNNFHAAHRLSLESQDAKESIITCQAPLLNLYNDGAIKRTDSGQHVAAQCPDSPRSDRLSMQLNAIIDKSGDHQVLVEKTQTHICLRRAQP